MSRQTSKKRWQGIYIKVPFKRTGLQEPFKSHKLAMARGPRFVFFEVTLGKILGFYSPLELYKQAFARGSSNINAKVIGGELIRTIGRWPIRFTHLSFHFASWGIEFIQGGSYRIYGIMHCNSDMVCVLERSPQGGTLGVYTGAELQGRFFGT
jgi:hypothetical protein